MLPLYAPAVSGIVMLALAGWLLWLSSERRQARAFALLLIIRGFSLIVLTISPTATTLSLASLASVLYPVLCFGAAIAALYFVAVYPAPRAWLPKGLLGPALFFGPFLVVLAWALIDPGIVWPGFAAAETGFKALFDRVAAATKGPIAVAPTLLDFVLVIPAFVLVRDYLGSPPGRKRSTLLLVSFGFFAPAACSCLIAGAFLQMRNDVPRPSNPSLFNHVEAGIFVAWFLIMVILIGYLIVRALREPKTGNRRAAAMFALLVVLSTGIGAVAASISDPLDSVAAIFVMVAAWSALGALIVTYAVVRQSLFDIDVRFKRTIEQGTIAAVFVAVYFVVTETATQLLTDFAGSAYLGIGAAALLLFTLHPLERFAAKMASGAMPKVKPLSELDQAESILFYREQVELMWMDGVLSRKDRVVLANLRSRLQLEADLAERIELETVNSGTVDET
jgi:hypothetical protein